MIRSMSRAAIKAGALVLCLALAGPAAAGDMVNVDKDGVAIQGYDPVAYFTLGRPMPGDPAHSHEWRDAEWRFSSEEHRALFARDPEKYAPRYGGFCAGAVAEGFRGVANPEVFLIRDGKLYLSFNEEALTIFEEREAEAEENWETIGQTN